MSTPAPAPAPDFGRGKTIFVLAIVIGCFAVLWPKIFYPMLTASLSQTQEENDGYLRTERPFRPGPELMHPALRERNRALPTMNIPRRTIERESHPGPLPGMRPPVGGAGHIPTAPKGGGTMGIIMPMYTIGIVCFFLYTIMKILFKKNPEAEQPVKPQVKDYGMDPEHRKYVFSEEYTEGSERSIRDAYNKEDRDKGIRRRPTGAKSGRYCEDRRRLGNRERDARDVEIDLLKRKLEETEAAMERIVAQMGSVTHQLSPEILAQVLKAKGEELEKTIASAAAERFAETKEDMEKASSSSHESAQSSNLEKGAVERRKSSDKEVKFKLPPEELVVKEESGEEDEEVEADRDEEVEAVVEKAKDDSESEEEEKKREVTRPPTPPKSLSKKSNKLAISPETPSEEVKQGKWSNASSPDMDEYEVIAKATEEPKPQISSILFPQNGPRLNTKCMPRRRNKDLKKLRQKLLQKDTKDSDDEE